MIFPDEDDKLAERVNWLVQRCTQTQRERTTTYDWRERYYLWGTADNAQPVRYNRLQSHIDLVSSFLYAPDHAFFNLAAGRNAPETLIEQTTALQDELNDDFADSGLNEIVTDAIEWSLIYNTMHIKQGWNDATGQQFATLIPPHAFGVFREDLPGLDQQEAFTHTYVLEYYDAVQRMVRAGRSSEVDKLRVIQEARPNPYPEMISRMIISATGGTNLAGNMIGAINPNYWTRDTYQPQSRHPMVMMHELWAWDSEHNDYRTFHVIEPDIVIGDSKKTIAAMLSSPKARKLLERGKRVRGRGKAARDGELSPLFSTEAPGDDDLKISPTNLFLPGDTPFTKIQAYSKYNFYWGICHLDQLASLQDWQNQRFEQIGDLLDKQVSPPKVGTGMGGISEEKFEAFGAADTWLMEQMPNAKVEELHPKMPEDLFAEIKEMGAYFLEASGLTDIIAGAGGENIRSGKQARQAKQTGAGRIKKAALRLQPSLIHLGDVGLKLKMKNDENPIYPSVGPPFIAAQIAGPVKIRIQGHAFSPLFSDDAKEMALLLKKVDAIDNEILVRMLNPPNIDAILHAQKKQAAAKAKMLASLPPEERMQMITGGAGQKRQTRK